MQRLDRFESTSTTARPLHLAAGSTIRVCHGRLWLTMDRQLDDVWLAPGDVWVAGRPVTVWLSGEPQAGFELLHPVAPKMGGLAWSAWFSLFALIAGARALVLRLSANRGPGLKRITRAIEGFQP